MYPDALSRTRSALLNASRVGWTGGEETSASRSISGPPHAPAPQPRDALPESLNGHRSHYDDERGALFLGSLAIRSSDEPSLRVGRTHSSPEKRAQGIGRPNPRDDAPIEANDRCAEAGQQPPRRTNPDPWRRTILTIVASPETKSRRAERTQAPRPGRTQAPRAERTQF